jgi:hypothetical protein
MSPSYKCYRGAGHGFHDIMARTKGSEAQVSATETSLKMLPISFVLVVCMTVDISQVHIYLEAERRRSGYAFFIDPTVNLPVMVRRGGSSLSWPSTALVASLILRELRTDLCPCFCELSPHSSRRRAFFRVTLSDGGRYLTSSQVVTDPLFG